MKRISTIPLVLVFAAGAWAQPGPTGEFARFGIDLNLRKYPQSDHPQTAIKSIVKAITAGEMDYVMAHLADPTYVDNKVKQYTKLYEGPEDAKRLVAFHQLVKEVKIHLQKDPSLLQELKRFTELDTKQWDIDKATGTAVGRLSTESPQHAFLVQIKGRWYLRNQR